jgi:hypothetical protein
MLNEESPMLPKFDVVAVRKSSLVAGAVPALLVRMVCRNKTKADAEAKIKTCIRLLGNDEEFFATTRPGMYHDNENWRGPE